LEGKRLEVIRNGADISGGVKVKKETQLKKHPIIIEVSNFVF